MVEAVSPIYQGGDHPWCGKRVYVDPGDKTLYATALAAAISGQTVSFYYDDAAPPVAIDGHQASFICKVWSLWLP